MPNVGLLLEHQGLPPGPGSGGSRISASGLTSRRMKMLKALSCCRTTVSRLAPGSATRPTFLPSRGFYTAESLATSSPTGDRRHTHTYYHTNSSKLHLMTYAVYDEWLICSFEPMSFLFCTYFALQSSFSGVQSVKRVCLETAVAKKKIVWNPILVPHWQKSRNWDFVCKRSDTGATRVTEQKNFI